MAATQLWLTAVPSASQVFRVVKYLITLCLISKCLVVKCTVYHTTKMMREETSVSSSLPIFAKSKFLNLQFKINVVYTCVCSSVVTTPKSRDATQNAKINPHLQRWHCDCLNKLSVGSMAKGRFCKLWLLIGRDSVSKAIVFTISCLLYWFVGGQGLSCWKEDYKELYCYPSLSFPLNFLSVTSLPPQPHTGPGLTFPVRQLSLVSGCYPFLDSHNRKKDESVE